MMKFLDNLRLTLTHYLLLTAAAAIGILVVMLRVQGGKLHKAKIEALTASEKARRGVAEKQLEASKAKAKAAREAYNKARKRVK